MKVFKICFIFLLFTLTKGGSLKEAYDSLLWGRRLVGRLLTTIVQVSPLDCAEECLVRPGCLSFNYRRAALFCELNYENDSSTDTNLKHEDGWIFGRRESWPMELTEECQHKRCGINEKCVLKPLHTTACEVEFCHPLNLTLPKNVKKFSSDKAVDFGSKHRLSCLDEYDRTGDGIVRCLWDGTWSEVNITCGKPIGRCYYRYINDTKRKWSDSKILCEGDGYLLEIQSKEEYQFIRKEIIEKDGRFKAWIGGHKQNSKWIWSHSKSYINTTELGSIVEPHVTDFKESKKCLMMNKEKVKVYGCNTEDVYTLCEYDKCMSNH